MFLLLLKKKKYDLYLIDHNISMEVALIHSTNLNNYIISKIEITSIYFNKFYELYINNKF